MEDIFDRSKWPPAEENPLVRLFNSGDDWFSNKALAEALQLVNTTRSKSVVGHYKNLLEEIGPENTKLERPSFQGHDMGREMRLYSRKAFILIAMRSRTRNARAFCDWLAQRIADGGLRG